MSYCLQEAPPEMKVNAVDAHFEAMLAHEVVFHRVTNEYSRLRNTVKYPTPFFKRATSELKGRRRTRPHRMIATESLVTWARWGEIMRSALSCAVDDAATRKRIIRSSRCAPAGVLINSKYHHYCECYPCPMCWYRHVRAMLQRLNEALEAKAVGPVVRLQGIDRRSMTTLPDRAAYRARFDEITNVRDRVNALGSMATVRLLGQPGAWSLDADLLTVGVPANELRAIANATVDAMEWETFAYTTREGGLLRSISQCLHYPTGLLHPKMDPVELYNIFAGMRLFRSKVTGIFSKRGS